MRKLFVLFLALLLLTPTVLAAAQQHTVRGDLQSFGRGIQSLVPPGTSMSGFIDGMLGSLPLFGLIIVVFGLMFFITKVSIFKSPEHDKYARMIAIGIALLGLAQQSVYNAILNLSTTFLILAFLIAVVFMFTMFLNYNRKRHLESYTDLHKTTGTALAARRDLEKIKTELKHDKNLYNKIERDLASLDTDLQGIRKLSGDELRQVDKLAEMLRKATAASQAGNMGAVKEYVNALSRDLGSLITTMQHEQKHDLHLNDLTSKIQAEIAKWGHNSDQEKSEEEHLKQLFHKLSRTWGHKVTDDELNGLYKEEHLLVKQLRSIRKHLHELQSLYDKVMKEVEQLDAASYQRKHLEANAVRDNIMNQQFNEAHKHLDNLRAIIELEPSLIKRLRNHNNDCIRLLSHIDEEEYKVNNLIKNRMLKALKKVREEVKTEKDDKKTKEKNKSREYERQSNMIVSWVHDIRSSLSQLFGVAHPYLTWDQEHEVNSKKGKEKQIRERRRREVEEILNFINVQNHQLSEYEKRLKHDKVNLRDMVNSLIDRSRAIQAQLKISARGLSSGDMDRVSNQIEATTRFIAKVEEKLAEYLGKLKKAEKGSKDDSWDSSQKTEDVDYTLVK